MSVAALGLVSPAVAQDCKKEITASGNARPTQAWAKSLADNMWKKQVQATYGEQYEEIGNAKDVNYRCSGSSFGRRCTLTAVPCRVEGTKTAVVEPERLARELQRELQRVGCYSGNIDGHWGDGSRAALERFAKRTDSNFKADEPSRKALEAVEEATKRVCR
jgi:hypothetical protein